MSQKSLHIQFEEFENIQQVDASIQELLQVTRAFASHAYAPYSRFNVSACLRLEDGQILKGTNVENASYPVGICAERTVLAHAISNFPDQKIVQLAIFVDKDLNQAVPPCGLCRQTLAEAETRQDAPIELYLISYGGKITKFKSCHDLLPFSFGGEFL